MWWSRSLLAALALASCGFSPALAPGGGAETLQDAVRTQNPETRAEFILTQRIAERLGRPAPARYDLDVTLDIDARPAAFTPERDILRYTLEGTATFVLLDRESGARTEGLVRSTTAWSASGSTVATITAEDDARDRLATILADEIVTRLIATAG